MFDGLKSRSWPCGHPRTAANTQSVGSAGVRCRQCRLVINRRSRERQQRLAVAAAPSPAPAPPAPAARAAPSQPDMFPEAFR